MGGGTWKEMFLVSGFLVEREVGIRFFIFSNFQGTACSLTLLRGERLCDLKELTLTISRAHYFSADWNSSSSDILQTIIILTLLTKTIKYIKILKIIYSCSLFGWENTGRGSSSSAPSHSTSFAELSVSNRRHHATPDPTTCAWTIWTCGVTS